MRPHRILLSVALFLLLPAACTGPESDLCTAKKDCEGGNDTDLVVCEIQADANADIADEKGCIDLYDQAVECFADNGACVTAEFKYSTDCDDLFERLNLCVGEVLDIGTTTPTPPPEDEMGS